MIARRDLIFLVALTVLVTAVITALTTYAILNEVERHQHHQIGYGSVMICQPWTQPNTWMCNT